MTASNGHGTTESETSPPEGSVFKSELGQGADAFLSDLIVQGLALGERQPEDFLRHFPARDIMSVLPPKLRADILIGAGVLGPKMRKAAEKKSPESAGEDLQIALDEGGTDAKTVVDAFEPDARVLHLKHRSLWAYAIETAFWNRENADDVPGARARAYLAHILQSALDNELIFPKQVVDALTMKRLAEDLPKGLLGAMLEAALASDQKFSEITLLDAVPPKALVNHVNLAYIWERVVEPLIAQKHGYMDPPQEQDVVITEAVVEESSGEAAPEVSDPKA